MAFIRAPKQWVLTKTETFSTFEAWRQNLVYSLALDKQFAPFLKESVTWKKKHPSDPNRGLVDDTVETDGVNVIVQTADQKVVILELLLGQIANYCPIINRNTIIKNSTSVESVWQTIRLHYGFQTTGGHFIDLADIKFEIDERPEDLYQRLSSFIEDSLLIRGSSITHHGETIMVDEVLTPTVENLLVLMWLKLIDPDLPKLIKHVV